MLKLYTTATGKIWGISMTTTIMSNTVIVDVTSSTATTCKIGKYITVNGTYYPYTIVSSLPSGYSVVTTPSFCIYYESAGGALTGCYCSSASQIYMTRTHFYTNGAGGWSAEIVLLPTYVTFYITWSEKTWTMNTT